MEKTIKLRNGGKIICGKVKEKDKVRGFSPSNYCIGCGALLEEGRKGFCARCE